MNVTDYTDVLEQFILSHDTLSKFDYTIDRYDTENTVMAYVKMPVIDDILIVNIQNDFIDYLQDKEIDYVNALVTTTSQTDELVIDLIYPSDDNVQEHVMKMQKPEVDTFVNVHDGMGDCTICGADNVVIDDHVCMTTVNLTEKIFTTIKEFKMYFENKTDASLKDLKIK
jgi:hypothetical protein